MKGAKGGRVLVRSKQASMCILCERLHRRDTVGLVREWRVNAVAARPSHVIEEATDRPYWLGT